MLKINSCLRLKIAIHQDAQANGLDSLYKTNVRIANGFACGSDLQSNSDPQTTNNNRN